MIFISTRGTRNKNHCYVTIDFMIIPSPTMTERSEHHLRHHHHLCICCLYVTTCFLVACYFILQLLSFSSPSPMQLAVRGAQMADAPHCIVPHPLSFPDPPNHVTYHIDGHVIATSTVSHRIQCTAKWMCRHVQINK